MGGRGSSLGKGRGGDLGGGGGRGMDGMGGPAADAPSDAEVEATVREAFHAVLAAKGDPDIKWVTIADLRAQLPPDVDRATVDRVLDKMIESPDVDINPALNRRILTDQERDDAVDIGGEPRHLMRISGPADSGGESGEPLASEQNRAGTAAAPSRLVSGETSQAPVLPNDWGTISKADGINFHDDGQIGTAIKNMGTDARMDVDGEPVANVLGRVATDVVTGRRTAAEGVEAYKEIRDRLPVGSEARQNLDFAITRIDAPASAPPEVPAGAPEPLKKLMDELHSIPLLRRDPQETTKLQEILRENFDDDADDGPIHVRSLARELRELNGVRHESDGDAGKFDVNRAVDRAIDALTEREQRS
ncbi:hypothetical protein ABZ342_27260 [Amycolatopsis sp. NPDC005961]|uniref:hypothetical protein n=1 Tax=Amycolatopsis sp. NPDC005961 TaxID=3156720 RepID=UPI0033F4C387